MEYLQIAYLPPLSYLFLQLLINKLPSLSRIFFVKKYAANA